MNHIGRALKDNEKPIRIGFVGFHKAFNLMWNHISISLLPDFPIEIANTSEGEVPDYLFFSVFGSSHMNHLFDNCIKIFTCEENIRVPWSECDYALSSDRILYNPYYKRLPIYTRFLRHHLDHTGETLIKSFRDDELKSALARKSRFCNFVYSNGSAEERILFFEMLSKYKRVDSGGSVLNNLGGVRVGDKLAFLRDYKFTIAFENSRYPGYVSEKIVEPMASLSIPIYWGCRSIGEDFNAFSFVNANEPEGSDKNELVHHFAQVIRKIIWLDTHDDDYLAMLAEPWFHDNQPNAYCKANYLTEFMNQVFETPRSCLPKRSPAPVPTVLEPAPLSPEPSNQSTRGWSWADHLTTPRKNPHVKK